MPRGDQVQQSQQRSEWRLCVRPRELAYIDQLLEANVFAAAVLMPARLVREQYDRSDRDFFRLCETFGASGAAMGRRLHAVIRP